jgi:hypothetical protein
MRLEFSGQVFEETKILNFIKIRPTGIELFYADKHRDGHGKANCRFSQFCEKRLKTV